MTRQKEDEMIADVMEALEKVRRAAALIEKYPDIYYPLKAVLGVEDAVKFLEFIERSKVA